MLYRSINIFPFVQELYNFLSASTYRWELLKTHLEKNKTPVVKSLSDSRWSARAEVVKALVKGYKEIQSCLQEISEDPGVKPAVRLEAQGIELKFQNFQIIFLSLFWNDILERVDKCNNNLQKHTLDLLAGSKQLRTLETFIKDKREEFNTYEKTAIDILDCKTPTYNRNRRRKIFADETRGVESDLDERTAFRVNVYNTIIDSLLVNLARKRESYDALVDRFETLTLLLSETSNEAIIKAATKLTQFYDDDINVDFPNECCHFKAYIDLEQIQRIPQMFMFTRIKQNNLGITFPNLEIALRIFLTLPITNCTAERGFSVLTRVKKSKRSTLSDRKLNSSINVL